MSRRIDIELTSSRDDGAWTWRAAGAKQPKGVLDGSLLPAGAKVGDVVRADADIDVEGITVLAVLPPKSARAEPDRLELLGPQPHDRDELVTTSLVSRSRSDRSERSDRGDRGPRGPRPDRPPRDDRGDRDRRGPRRDRPQSGDRPPSGDHPPRDETAGRDKADQHKRGERSDRPRPPRRPAAVVETKPKPKRLRPGRVHRKAVLDDLPPEQRLIAEQVLSGGIPQVRQAIEKQNETLRGEGKPEIKADPLVALAEELLPRLRTAEWLDRADAALAEIDELDLRDLRQVVVAADVAARDEPTRELAATLREALTRRVDAEQTAWMADLSAALAEGRVVRALRLSSRPPKAGVLLPPDLTTRLADAAAGALTADITTDRWSTVLDAVAFSPVRRSVRPGSVPDAPSDELKAVITRYASRLPAIAAAFGIEPPPEPAPTRRGRQATSST